MVSARDASASEKTKTLKLKSRHQGLLTDSQKWPGQHSQFMRCVPRICLYVLSFESGLRCLRTKKEQGAGQSWERWRWRVVNMRLLLLTILVFFVLKANKKQLSSPQRHDQDNHAYQDHHYHCQPDQNNICHLLMQFPHNSRLHNWWMVNVDYVPGDMRRCQQDQIEESPSSGNERRSSVSTWWDDEMQHWNVPK